MTSGAGMEDSILETTRNNYLFNLKSALTSINNNKNFPSSYFMSTLSYRILGICALLIEADVDSFFGMLQKSGQARLHFLKLVKKGLQTDPKYLCVSKDVGFASALAAGDLDLAKEIVSYSPKIHFENVEYEDDFLFPHFLMSILINPYDKKYLKQILDRWQTVIEGQNSGYYNVCSGLLSEDQDNFSEAFDSLIETRIDELEEYKKNFSYDKEMYAAEGNIFIEGLAVLRIAELKGLSNFREYHLIPEIVRVANISQLNQDSWKIVK